MVIAISSSKHVKLIVMRADSWIQSWVSLIGVGSFAFDPEAGVDIVKVERVIYFYKRIAYSSVEDKPVLLHIRQKGTLPCSRHFSFLLHFVPFESIQIKTPHKVGLLVRTI